jgi:hypothetical protein
MSISSTERSKIEKSLSPQTLLSAGVIRLYRTTGQQWDYTGIIGIAAFSTDPTNKSANITIFDTSNFGKIFEQELYYNFKYDTPKSFFHTFEVTDCVAGFSFADDEEARLFSMSVNSNLPNQSHQVSAPMSHSPPTTTTAPTPTSHSADSHNSPAKEEKKKGTGFFTNLFAAKKSQKRFSSLDQLTSDMNLISVGIQLMALILKTFLLHGKNYSKKQESRKAICRIKTQQNLS